MSTSTDERYIMDLSKCLGSGITADVFLGIRVSNGSLCAMKCSKSIKMNKALKNEINIMKDLNHENIVKLYDDLPNFECQRRKFERVIVMEYCNHGSLYDFAELHKGLCDNMFLRVLECLNHGLSYLRDRKLLHRDIKPGNMMVHQDRMGYYHVKLGDLGTAKKVQSDETFQTLCGTQEYLHPDMLIEQLDGNLGNYTIDVDLWSTGITLYHAATSKLPFMPFKYNRANPNSANMLKHMYLNKAAGVISARQNSDNKDDITWSDTLPDNCRLSPMLTDISSKLIGNLLDRSKDNTYERFFKQANSIANKKRILVFNSYKGDLLILYLDNLTYASVADKISESVGFPLEDLILLTRNKVLRPLSEVDAECVRSMPVKGHLRYTLTDDTILVIVNKVQGQLDSLTSKGTLDDNCTKPLEMYKPYFKAKKYSQDVLSSIYQVGYQANYIDCQLDCYLATMFAFNQYVLNDDLTLMHDCLQWQLKFSRTISSTTKSLIDLAETTISNIHTHKNACDGFLQCKENIVKFDDLTDRSEEKVNDYYQRIVVNRDMFKYTKKKFYDIGDAETNDDLNFLVHLAEELANEMLIIPENKIYQDDDTYKLEVWQRHVRLYKHLQVAKERLDAKYKRFNKAHDYFIPVRKSGINLLNNIKSWKNNSKTNEEKGTAIIVRFHEIIDWWKTVVTPYVEKDDLKTRIIQIRDVTSKLMELASPINE